MTNGRLVLPALAMVMIPHVLAAQRARVRPIELGFDGALLYESTDNNKATALTFPLTKFRVGFFTTDAVSIEPSFAFVWSRNTSTNPFTGQERTVSATSYDFDVSLLYHFSTDRSKTQTFVRPYVGFRGFNGSGSSGSQAAFGGALGIKKPIGDHRLAGRFEVGYEHRTEDSGAFASANRAFLSFGLSFFTH